MKNILLIEHEIKNYQAVSQAVSSFSELKWVQSIKEAKEELKKNTYHLTIINVVLPDGSGIDFCTNTQLSQPEMMIFLISDHANLSETVLSFTAGADDFMTIPFSPLELKARIESRFKKTKNQSMRNDSCKWKELHICKSKQEVSILQKDTFKKIDLTALEFKILMYFALRPGEVIVRDQMLNDIWGINIHVYQRSVDTHISKLRKKLGVVSYILESIHGLGYKFKPTNLC
jgi:two-component system phosphate regulon response regulator PhoB